MKYVIVCLSLLFFVSCGSDNGDTMTTSDDGPMSGGDDNPTSMADVQYTVGNNGAMTYIFTGDGLNNSMNPALTLKRGMTYDFVISTPGHPFYIKTIQGTGSANAYNNGLTNNGTQDGTLRFTVPMDAPDTLFYNCEFHTPMTNTITIID